MGDGKQLCAPAWMGAERIVRERLAAIRPGMTVAAHGVVADAGGAKIVSR